VSYIKWYIYLPLAYNVLRFSPWWLFRCGLLCCATCGLVGGYQRYRVICCFHHQGWSLLLYCTWGSGFLRTVCIQLQYYMKALCRRLHSVISQV